MPITEEIKNRIITDFFQPFLNYLDNNKNPNKNITIFKKNLLRYSYMHLQYELTTEENFTEKFASEPEEYRKFLRLYLFPNICQQFFPECSHAAFQTCIRELFFEHEYALSPSSAIDKLLEDAEGDHVYYAVMGEVELTTMNFCSFYSDIKKIKDDVLIKSFKEFKEKDIKLFANLYEAFEYMTYTSPPILGTTTQVVEKIQRAIWKVNYKGDSNLDIKTALFKLHEHSPTERMAEVSYAEVPIDQLQVLLGTVVIDYNRDGNYTSTYNFIDLTTPKNEPERCLVM